MTSLAVHKMQRLSGVSNIKDTPSALVEIYNANLKNSPLLLLPTELRVIIYEYVLAYFHSVWLLRRGQKVVTTVHRRRFLNANVFQKLCKFTSEESRRLEFKLNYVAFMNDALDAHK